MTATKRYLRKLRNFQEGHVTVRTKGNFSYSRWERIPANASRVDDFKRDYADINIGVMDLIKRYDMGLNAAAAHRAARRLGLPSRKGPRIPAAGVRVCTTLDSIQAERDRLMALVRSLDVRAAALQVCVTTIAGDRVSISGLAEQPFVTDLAQVKAFRDGGGLGRLRDLVGKTKASQ